MGEADTLTALSCYNQPCPAKYSQWLTLMISSLINSWDTNVFM